MSYETIHVLSIEDNAGDARLIQEMLGKASALGWDLPHFALSHAHRLAEGLARLDEGGIDVVLTDLDLPDSRAGDTFAPLRAHAPHLPIVVLTGREDAELARHTVRAGAEDYLFKREMNGSLLAHALLYAIERQRTRAALQAAHDDLERRVQARTAELAQANAQLRQEMAERAQVEESLRRSRESYHSFISHSHEAIYCTEFDEPIDISLPVEEQIDAIYQNAYMGECNQAMAAMYGLPSVDAFVGQRLIDFHGGKDNPVNRATFRTLIESNYRSIDCETEEVTPQGEKRFFLTSDFGIVQDGYLLRIWGVAADITERKQAEEALRDERRRLAGILRGTNAGTWEWNVQTGETIFNERWAEIVGYTLEEISPVSIDTWIEFCHPDDLRASDELLEKHFCGELDYYELEARMKHKDGSWVWVLDRGRVVSWTEDGTPLMMMGTHQDITGRKQAEEERETLRAQLAQAQKMESVGRLAGGVAHDFNNMLGAIIGHAELALQQVEPGGMLYDDLEEIRQAARRSASLTRQLLAFARKQVVTPKVLDLNTTVDGMLKMLRRLIGEAVELAWVPGEGLWPVEIDPNQLDQVLVNLCVNARDAIDGVGTITIETKNVAGDDLARKRGASLEPGDNVLLAVSDDGSGMDQEVLAHIFEPYYTTKGVGQGTGLGLATVYGIVEMNDGFIQVSSEPGRGTTFNIYLPRSEGQISSDSAKHPGLKGGRETVLFVEDEPANLRLGRAVLERLGYTVLTASRPSEALNHAQAYAGEIDLLVTDVVMPEMNGPDLAAQVVPLNPGMRCLFMSGYAADIVSQKSVLKEGGWFLQKPFSIDELATKVREVLEQGDEQ